jgi:hypothetical protein
MLAGCAEIQGFGVFGLAACASIRSRQAVLEYLKDVDAEMVPDQYFQARNAEFRTCDWRLLAWVFRWLCFFSHRFSRRQLSVCDIHLVEAVVQPKPAKRSLPASRRVHRVAPM